MSHDVVRDFTAIATLAFRRVAGATWQSLKRRGLAEDYRQELNLAAWKASRRRLRADTAIRFCARQAYHALRAMGYARVRGGPPHLIPRA